MTEEARGFIEDLLDRLAKAHKPAQREASRYPPGTKVIGKDGVAYIVHKNLREKDKRLFLDRVDGRKDIWVFLWGDIALYEEGVGWILKNLEEERAGLRQALTQTEHYQESIMLLVKSLEEGL